MGNVDRGIEGLWVDFGGGRDSNAFQVVAALESLFSDFFQLRALSEDDLAELITVVECFLSYCLHTRWNLHFCEAGLVERTFSDFPQLRFLHEGHFLYLLTVFEGPFSNNLHTGWYLHFSEASFVECLLSNFFQLVRHIYAL